MDPEEVRRINAHQREVFNRVVEAFDTPQPPGVMVRLEEIVAAAAVAPGETVLDVGTGVGVLIPLIRAYQPGRIIVCDLAEKMLARVQRKYPEVETHLADIATLSIPAFSVDVVFMNAMYGNIADKPAAHRNLSRILRPGGRLVVSHPEGRTFVDQLRATSDLFIEAYPTREEFREALASVGLMLEQFRDEPHLYLMLARRTR